MNDPWAKGGVLWSRMLAGADLRTGVVTSIDLDGTVKKETVDGFGYHPLPGDPPRDHREEAPQAPPDQTQGV